MVRLKKQDIETLADEFETPSRKLTATPSGLILEPLLYDKKTLFHQFNELKLQSQIRKIVKEAIDSKTEVDLEQALEEACEAVGVSRAWAEKYFKSKRYKDWYVDRMKEIADHSGITIEYLASKHRDNLEGKLKLSGSQLESAKELGDRIWPKVSKIEHEISQKEATTLDEMPDYQRKVEQYQNELRKRVEENIDVV